MKFVLTYRNSKILNTIKFTQYENFVLTLKNMKPIQKKKAEQRNCTVLTKFYYGKQIICTYKLLCEKMCLTQYARPA